MHRKGNLGTMKRIKNKSTPYPKFTNNNKKSILIVDDDEHTLAFLSAILNIIGHQPACVQGGKDALKAVVEKDYDLVITDIMMPEISGLEVAKGIIIINPKTKVLFLSALLHDENTRKYAESLPGCVGVLPKPILPKKLQELVEKILE